MTIDAAAAQRFLADQFDAQVRDCAATGPLSPATALSCPTAAWQRVFGMVNAAPSFTQLPQVINGCSDLILELYGPERGAHAGCLLCYDGRAVRCAQQKECVNDCRGDRLRPGAHHARPRDHRPARGSE